MVWKYKINLRDIEVFDKIQKLQQIFIPEEVKELIMEANAATPEKYHFMVGGKEKALGAILSFNEKESDTDTIYTALKVVKDKNLFPFAIDPFGNYLCIDRKQGTVIYWEHETEDIFSTKKNLTEFLKALY